MSRIVEFSRCNEADEEIAAINFPALSLEGSLKEQFSLELKDYHYPFQILSFDYTEENLKVVVQFDVDLSIQELVKDLQNFYDESGMSGQFEVKSSSST